MKKTLFPLLSIFLFSTTAVFGDIPRSNVNKVKQLNWSEIIDAVSQTYQFGIYFSDQVKQDGSTFNYPTDEKYGRLSQNGIGRYLYKDTKFYDYEPFYGAWSVDKQENKICHGNSGDSIDKHICEHLYEGFEMGIKYLYFSETKNGNFYARKNQIIPIDNTLQVFTQWSLKSKSASKNNKINVQEYALQKKAEEEKEQEQDLIALEHEVSRLWDEKNRQKTRNEIRKELKKKIINGGYKSFTSMNEMELEISRLWEEGDGQKTRREIRKELKEKIKNGGYKSLALMKKEEERKKKEEERITAAINKEEKRIEIYINKFKGLSTKLKDLELDSLKVEVDELISEVEANTSSDLNVLKGLNKTLREMNSSVELKIKTEESKQRVLSLKDYPGFRDLKPGLHYEDLTEFCHLRKGYWVKCYGIDNIKFYGKFKNDVLYELILDMGPIVNTEGFLSVFGENDSNILIKMRKTMDKNYSRDYGYSERDRQLFNESEKSRLYEVYSGGKVVLEINRKEKDWSSDLWLYIHYLDHSKAETFLNENRPVRASDDDF